jgi:hypothetical protein
VNNSSFIRARRFTGSGDFLSVFKHLISYSCRCSALVDLQRGFSKLPGTGQPGRLDRCRSAQHTIGRRGIRRPDRPSSARPPSMTSDPHGHRAENPLYLATRACPVALEWANVPPGDSTAEHLAHCQVMVPGSTCRFAITPTQALFRGLTRDSHQSSQLAQGHPHSLMNGTRNRPFPHRDRGGRSPRSPEYRADLRGRGA